MREGSQSSPAPVSPGVAAPQACTAPGSLRRAMMAHRPPSSSTPLDLTSSTGRPVSWFSEGARASTRESARPTGTAGSAQVRRHMASFVHPSLVFPSACSCPRSCCQASQPSRRAPCLRAPATATSERRAPRTAAKTSTPLIFSRPPVGPEQRRGVRLTPGPTGRPNSTITGTKTVPPAGAPASRPIAGPPPRTRAARPAPARDRPARREASPHNNACPNRAQAPEATTRSETKRQVARVGRPFRTPPSGGRSLVIWRSLEFLRQPQETRS